MSWNPFKKKEKEVKPVAQEAIPRTNVAMKPMNYSSMVILAWAKQHQCIVFTNDLDFGAILALSKGKTPSVFQLRTQDLLPQSIGKIVIENLERFQLELSQGALISLELDRAKVRILPII